jgi:hypothetical protein
LVDNNAFDRYIEAVASSRFVRFINIIVACSNRSTTPISQPIGEGGCPNLKKKKKSIIRGVEEGCPYRKKFNNINLLLFSTYFFTLVLCLPAKYFAATFWPYVVQSVGDTYHIVFFSQQGTEVSKFYVAAFS